MGHSNPNVRLKHSVYPAGVHKRVVSAIAVAGRVYREVAGEPCVVTSLVDGRHRHDSFHYAGLAVDLRTKHLDPSEKTEVVHNLRHDLPDVWDVFLEYRGEVREHIHMELDDRDLVTAHLNKLEEQFMERLGVFT